MWSIFKDLGIKNSTVSVANDPALTFFHHSLLCTATFDSYFNLHKNEAYAAMLAFRHLLLLRFKNHGEYFIVAS